MVKGFVSLGRRANEFARNGQQQRMEFRSLNLEGVEVVNTRKDFVKSSLHPVIGE